MRLVLTDLYGVARGKLVAAERMERALADGHPFAIPLFASNLWQRHAPGEHAYSTDIGYRNGVLRLDPLTFTPLPWTPGTAHVITDLYDDAGAIVATPRAVLRRVLRRRAGAGPAPGVRERAGVLRLPARPRRVGLPARLRAAVVVLHPRARGGPGVRGPAGPRGRADGTGAVRDLQRARRGPVRGEPGALRGPAGHRPGGGPEDRHQGGRALPGPAGHVHDPPDQPGHHPAERLPPAPVAAGRGGRERAGRRRRPRRAVRGGPALRGRPAGARGRP